MRARPSSRRSRTAWRPHHLRRPHPLPGDEERLAWEAKDPILRLRRFLEASNHTDERFFEELETESEALGRRVREAVRAMPDPDHFAIFENVYADGHALVDEERAQFAAYQASFADEEGATEMAETVTSKNMALAKAINESLRRAWSPTPRS